MIAVASNSKGFCVFILHTKQSQPELVRAAFVWCEKRDLNPYGVNHTPLKRARLPVPPLSRVVLDNSCIIPHSD